MNIFKHTHSNKRMSKTMTVSDEAYARLAARKKPGESFSDVIVKMSSAASLRDLVGLLSEERARELEKNIAENRARMRDEMDKRLARLHDL